MAKQHKPHFAHDVAHGGKKHRLTHGHATALVAAHARDDKAVLPIPGLKGWAEANTVHALSVRGLVRAGKTPTLTPAGEAVARHLAARGVKAPEVPRA
jgi:hypothetical protein